jgi:hypothetical protein
MALIEVEGVPVHLRELVMENLIASLDSIEDILVRHYMRQLLHEMYKARCSYASLLFFVVYIFDLSAHLDTSLVCFFMNVESCRCLVRLEL